IILIHVNYFSSSWCVNINNLIKSFFSWKPTKAQMLFVSFLLAASREFLVGRKLEVEDPSEVLQIMQMQAIGTRCTPD
ncbi:hypothetical protein Gotur_033561, partial [Gossypium turneri]